MIEGLGNTDRDNRPLLAARPAPVSVATPPAAAVSPSPVPASPPAEVLEMLDTAATVLHDLASAQVSLHIDVVDGAAGKRIHVQVLDASGTVLREIPPSQMFEVLAGTSRGLTCDEQV